MLLDPMTKNQLDIEGSDDRESLGCWEIQCLKIIRMLKDPYQLDVE